MKAVILAGGEGVRLRPLTCGQPKPMLEILGKPVLEYTLEHLKNHGVDEVFLTLQYLPQRVMEYFGTEYQGMKLHFCLEETPLGTAGCVKQLEKYLTETFFVISGDALSDTELNKALAFHREKKAEATLIVKNVDNPTEYGIVTCGDDGLVQRFQEKPAWSEVFSNLANTGMYILEPEALSLIPAAGSCDFSGDVFPKMLDEKRVVAGYITEGYWCDIGSHEAYLAAQFDLLEGRCRLQLLGGADRAGVLIAPDAQVETGAKLTPPCYVGSGCRIASGSVVGPRAFVGSGSCIERGAGIKNSVMGKNCRLGRGCQLRGAILGDGCCIKSGAELYENAVVADGAVIGAFARLAPGSRVWPGKQVEDFSRIQGAVRWGSTSLRRPLIGGCLRAEDWNEMPPERIFAWGSAAAAAAGGQLVVVSDDGSERAKTVRTALEAGAACAGAQLQPLAHANLAMHRFAQRMLHASLGVHVMAREQGFALCFTDQNGGNISTAVEKRLENALRRGVEPAAAPITAAPALEVEALYLAHLRSMVKTPVKGKTAVFCENSEMRLWAGRILQALGLEVLLCPKAPSAERKVPSGEYRARMLEAGANMGLRLEREQYQLVDGQGKLYHAWMLEPMMETSDPAIQSLVETDGLLTMVWFWEMCNGDLEAYAGKFPEKTRWERSIPCPWSEHGRINAELDSWPEFIRDDNGRCCRKDQKITIAPRDDMPLIRLVAQDVSQEMARELLGEYERKLLEQMGQ